MPRFVVSRREAWGMRALYEVEAADVGSHPAGPLFFYGDDDKLMLALSPGTWDEVVLKGTEAVVRLDAAKDTPPEEE